MEPVVEEAEPPIPETQFPVVFLDNLSEDVWPLIDALDNPDSFDVEILENQYLTDPHYLGIRAQSGSNLVTYVAPIALDSEFIDYVDTLLGTSGPVQIVVPPEHSGVISRDAAGMMGIWGKAIEMRSYCASRYLYKLIAQLREQGIAVTLPEMPDESKYCSTVELFGTKGGLRQALAAERRLDVPMAAGDVYPSLEGAVDKAVSETTLGKGIVIKTNKGHAGLGVVIYKPGELTGDESARREQIVIKLQKNNGFWDKFPVIVEEYIEPNISVGGGLPDVECLVKPDGSAEVLYTCGMRVVDGVFCGVEFGKDCFDAVHETELQRLGNQFGALYAESGYRGFFDVDCLADVNGKIIVSESNVRRTGGTYAYLVAKRLLGEAWSNFNMVTRTVTDPHMTLGFSELMTRLGQAGLLYDKVLKQGVIVASSQLLKMHKFSYLIVGHTREESLDYEKRMLTGLGLSWG